VADDVRDWFDGKRVLTAYVPFVQAPDANISFVMRTNGTPSRFAGSARAPSAMPIPTSQPSTSKVCGIGSPEKRPEYETRRP